ncbi:MAG: tRNA 2-thiouridine(34) synthase MnmA [Betaproteobacteria bacterium]
MAQKRVIVGMSGGVDSSVAAWLLKEQGFEVIGLFMKNWEDDDTDEYCTSREDLVDAVSVADRLGIDIEAVNFSAQYRERVFANFLSEYRAGRTPNPDVLCNSEIKFKAFLDHALELGADFIATGHYARVERDGDRVQLQKAADTSKDQSYFLYRLNQAQLSKTLFPLGDWLKRDVRELARKLELSIHAKRDSTGICFIGERPFREFLMRYLPTSPGPIESLDGKMLGTHQGLMYYTIGQRQGLGIGGEGDAWYVAGKDIAGNRLLVVQGHDHPALCNTKLTAGQLTWVAGDPPDDSRSYAAKTRYRQADASCVMTRLTSDACDIEFATAQWAITPGQSAVLYDGERCLGGGIIA